MKYHSIVFIAILGRKIIAGKRSLKVLPYGTIAVNGAFMIMVDLMFPRTSLLQGLFIYYYIIYYLLFILCFLMNLLVTLYLGSIFLFLPV